MQETKETWVLPLGQEDPLEKKMATHSSIIAWRIPWTKKPDGLQSTDSQGVSMTEALECARMQGNPNLLQCGD